MENAAALDERRKDKISKEAQAIFGSEVEGSSAEKASADADAAAVAQLAAANQLVNREDTGFVSATEAPGMSKSASPVVREAAARSLADELAKTESQMKARSVLQGWQQRQQQRGTQFGRTAERMMTLGNFSQGWDQVNKVDMGQAAHAGDERAMLGDVLTGLGQVGLAAYGAGAAKPAATAATTYVPAAAGNPATNPMAGYSIPYYGR